MGDIADSILDDAMQEEWLFGEDNHRPPPKRPPKRFTRRKQMANRVTKAKTELEVKFIQIISVSYTYSDGSGEGSSVVALGDNGCVYQYRRGEINAWVPFNQEIIGRI